MTTREDKILALTSAASRLARLSRLRDRDTEAAEAADAVDKAVSDLATWPIAETISADLIFSVAGYLMDRADAFDMIVKRESFGGMFSKSLPSGATATLASAS